MAKLCFNCPVLAMVYFIFISVPAILNEAVPATTQNVDGEIQAALKCAHKYTGIHSHNPEV